MSFCGLDVSKEMLIPAASPDTRAVDFGIEHHTLDLLRSNVQKLNNMLVIYHLQKITGNSRWYVNGT